MSQTLPEDIELIVVSRQSKEELVDFARKNSITIKLLSAKDSDFPEQFGVAIEETNDPESFWKDSLMRSAIITINGKIVDFSFVPDQAGEPDYGTVIEAAKAALH